MDARRKRRTALAARKRSQRPARRDERGHEERVELVQPLLDQKDVAGALDEKLGPKAVAANHLDGEAADVANLDLAPARESVPLMAHTPGRGDVKERVADGGAIRSGRRRRRPGGTGEACSPQPGHLAVRV